MEAYTYALRRVCYYKHIFKVAVNSYSADLKKLALTDIGGSNGSPILSQLPD